MTSVVIKKRNLDRGTHTVCFLPPTQPGLASAVLPVLSSHTHPHAAPVSTGLCYLLSQRILKPSSFQVPWGFQGFICGLWTTWKYLTILFMHWVGPNNSVRVGWVVSNRCLHVPLGNFNIPLCPVSLLEYPRVPGGTVWESRSCGLCSSARHSRGLSMA